MGSTKKVGTGRDTLFRGRLRYTAQVPMGVRAHRGQLRHIVLLRESESKFIKSLASGSSDLIYNNWKSNKTTYKSYNNIMKKEIIQINN